MREHTLLPGKFVWYELVSKDIEKARAFYGEVLGWRVAAFPMPGYTYQMIYAGATPDSMIGGFKQPSNDRDPSRWIAYVSVEDVDAATKAATANGGKVIEAPTDVPEVGRKAGIADPQGAELYLLKNNKGDPPDGHAPSGHFVWNELHTHEPQKALAFYEKVIGFTHRANDMGQGDTYYILSRGGVDRGGVTAHLDSGASSHWLPYVSVDDVDTTIARAKKMAAAILIPPADIPGVGRFGVLADPAGAALAVMKPQPMEQPQKQQQMTVQEAAAGQEVAAP